MSTGLTPRTPEAILRRRLTPSDHLAVSDAGCLMFEGVAERDRRGRRSVSDRALVIIVLKVGHREDVYREMS